METNKIIAKFMGGYELEEFEDYDTSWEWLMPVVEKIEQTNEGCTLVIIEDERCHIVNQIGFEIDSVGHTKIEAVYNACLIFIKWYNKNK